MARASHQQLAEFSKAMLELYRETTLETMGADFLRVLGRVIPSDYCVLNWVEADGIPRILSDRVYPKDATLEAFNAHCAEHPTLFAVFAKYCETHDPDYMVGRWSDHTSLRQFRKKALHREFFVPLETNYQSFVACPGAKGESNLAVSFQRRKRDFTDEEMLLLRLVGPHLEQIYRQASLQARVAEAMAAQAAALDGIAAMVVAPRDGTLLHCSPKARQLCERYFPGASCAAAAREIVRELRLRGAERFARVAGDAQLMVECQVLRRQCDAGKEICLLRFAEKDFRVAPRSLEQFGLTPREAEVLLWVAEGKTNEEIAIILGAKPGTVRKHVENIHRKLGVENRASAAAMARTFLP